MTGAARCILLGALAVLAPLVAEDRAAGGVARVEGDIRYIALPGETNALTVTEDRLGVLVTDAAVPVSPSRGCVAVDEHTARCSARYVFGIDVDLGDGDDVVTVHALNPPLERLLVLAGEGDDVVDARATGLGLLVDGEEGDDSIASGAGSDQLLGGPGRDTLTSGTSFDLLHGGPDDDVLDGGPGRDSLQASAGDDTMDGGPGGDLAWFDYAPGAVAVNLATGVATGWGTVALLGVEDLHGSRFGDRLVGDAGRNAIAGHGGNDWIAGGGDADRVWGEGGSDRTDGGAGDDRLDGGAGADRVLGASGRDVLVGGPGIDALAAGSGDDRLVMRDRRRDVGDGGPGRDCAILDREVDLVRNATDCGRPRDAEPTLTGRGPAGSHR